MRHTPPRARETCRIDAPRRPKWAVFRPRNPAHGAVSGPKQPPWARNLSSQQATPMTPRRGLRCYSGPTLPAGQLGVPMNSSRLALLPVGLALALLAVGCSSKSRTPLSPLTAQGVLERDAHLAAGPSANGGFYPLAVGNRWHLSRIFTLDYHGYGADTIRTSKDRVNIGTETVAGRTYFVEEETATQDSRPGEVFRSWSRYRQDQSGLYYRD